MLDWNTVLNYIKRRLAFPSSFIEETDSEIQEYLTEVTIPLFSEFFPDRNVAPCITSDETYQHSKDNHYYFFDPENLDIYDIAEVYFSVAGDTATGHPIVGVSSFEGYKEWALSTFKSRTFAPVSIFKGYTYRFFEPNIVRILPETSEEIAIEYEREQPHDLRRIPGYKKRDFMDLCAADVMIWLGGVRSRYSSISTAFGEINIRGDELESKGEDLKSRLVDKFQEETVPSFIIDIS